MESRLPAAPAVVTLLASLLLASFAPARAWADPTDRGEMKPLARKHLELGLQLYSEHEYEAAIREFRAGYTVDPRPELMFAMAQAERLSGDCTSAIAGYERFLAADPPEQQAAAARDAIERCRIALGSEIAEPTEDAADGARSSIATAPAPGSLSRTQVAAPAPEPAPTVAAPQADRGDDLRRPWYRDKVGATLLGTGAVAAAVGVGFYVASSSDESAASDARTYGEYQDLIDRAQHRRTVAWVGLATGATLAGTAAVWYLLRRDGGHEQRPTVGVSVDGDGAAVLYSTSF